MACCGLCRPKVKGPLKTNPNITTKKVERIDTWIENIDGPYEPITLPSKPPDQPKIISNQEEIILSQRTYQLSNTNQSIDRERIVHDHNAVSSRNVKNRKHNLQYLSSGLSINEEIQSAISENSTVNQR